MARVATNTWKPAFLKALRATGNVSAACRAAGLEHRSTAYDARARNAKFAAEWDEAMEDAVDALEAIARQRASVGGSDTLLIFLLKAHRPEMYRDNHRIEHVGRGGGPIEVKRDGFDVESFKAQFAEHVSGPVRDSTGLPDEDSADEPVHPADADA